MGYERGKLNSIYLLYGYIFASFRNTKYSICGDGSITSFNITEMTLKLDFRYSPSLRHDLII